MKNTLKYNLNNEIKFLYSDNNSLSIIFQNNEILSGVLGEFNCNIKELENITGLNIYTRGNSVSVRGDNKKNEIVKNAIRFLTEQYISNGSIEKEDILSSVNKFVVNEKTKNLNKISHIIKTPKKSVIPRSEKQKNM